LGLDFTHIIHMITIIAGTNRKNSNSLKVATYYQRQLDKKGFGSEILSLEELPDNFLVSDLYGARSESFQPIQDRITMTTKFIFIIPEYNGSFPGVLKMFIDACLFPDSFVGKKAALVGISSGKYGNIRGVEHFTGICHYLNLHTLPLRIHIPYINQELNQDVEFHREDTLRFTNQQIEEFLRF
jgi:chromate reductase, NAD(P)H dehydrogenase (quinone)